MKKLLVYLDEDTHEDLKILALRKKTTMAALVRKALESVYEDELDAIAGERSLEEAVRDQKSTMSWEEYKRIRAGQVRTSA